MSHCGKVKAILQKRKDKLHTKTVHVTPGVGTISWSSKQTRWSPQVQGEGGVRGEALVTGMKWVPQKPLLS